MKTFLGLLLVLAVVSANPETKSALDEDFGYVTVRPGAHMFWVTYHVDQPGVWTDFPLIMWLQGGPGSSGVGYGNFEELGPYYVNQSLREYAWTKKANVMFVDNPVGTGYSYVDFDSALTTTNAEIAADLVTLLKSVFTDYPDMSQMPFFVYAESYGGKMTVDFALALDAAIKAGEINCNFHGVALGDSWISPIDSVNTWGTFLYNMGFVDAAGQANIDTSAARVQTAVDAGNWGTATNLWSITEGVVNSNAGGINFYNVLATEDIYRSTLSKKDDRRLNFMTPEIKNLYKTHVYPTTRDSLSNLMNGPQKERWNISDDVVYDSQGGLVFNTLNEDFMKPVVDSVVNLLDNTDIYVAVYTGNLDLICDTPGTYRWIENMSFNNKPSWEASERTNFYVSSYSTKAGYSQNFENFGVYTILRSGHMVPTDAPVESFELIDMITANAALYKKNKQSEKSKKVAKVEKKTKVEHKKKKTNPSKPKNSHVNTKKSLKKKAKKAKKSIANQRPKKIGSVADHENVRRISQGIVPVEGKMPERVDAVTRKLSQNKLGFGTGQH